MNDSKKQIISSEEAINLVSQSLNLRHKKERNFKLIGKFDTNTGIDFGVTVGSGDASSADPSDVISFTTGGDEMMRLVTERTNYTTLAVGDTANVNYQGYMFVHGHEATQNGGSNIVRFEHQGTSPYGVQIHFTGQAPDNNTQHFLNWSLYIKQALYANENFHSCVISTVFTLALSLESFLF